MFLAFTAMVAITISITALTLPGIIYIVHVHVHEHWSREQSVVGPNPT